MDKSIFNLSELEYEIFNGFDISNLDTFIFYIELYKILPRSVIIGKLQDYYEINDIAVLNRAPIFSEIEEMYDVLIHVKSAKELDIVCPIFMSKDIETAINLRLNQYNLTFKHVTKLNYYELDGTVIETLYHPEILFKRILLEILNLKATDLHFTVHYCDGCAQYPIQYRVGSRLYNLNLFQLNEKLNSAIIKHLISHKTDNIALDLDNSAGVTTSISNIFSNKYVELRVSANRVRDGYRYVIRIQERTTTSLNINELGFDKTIQDGLFSLAQKVNGITFITGAIRTGKNTTAFAIANEMVKEPISIISYDSPIEVLMPFAQVDYREDASRLADCVRLAKKQDIDVAFLNELPSKNVAFAVADLINSSVGVVTTVHLNRLWDLPIRLYEYYGESYKDIILQINGVVNQKMFSVLCPSCKRKMKYYEIPDSDIVNFLESAGITEVYEKDRCMRCYNIRTDDSGYVIGKNQPYAEFLLFNDELKQSLVKCSSTWEMSLILKQTLFSKNQNLEFYMAKAVAEGKLHWSSLRSVL